MKRSRIIILTIFVIVVIVGFVVYQQINQPQTGCLSETTLTELLKKPASSDSLDSLTQVPVPDGTVYTVPFPFRWYNALSVGGDNIAELSLGTSADYVLQGDEVIVLMTFYPRGAEETALEEARFSQIAENPVYVPFLPEFDSVIATCQVAAGYRQANIIVAIDELHYLRVDVQSFNDPMQYIGTVKAIISHISAQAVG
jgi:hypothetical protein